MRSLGEIFGFVEPKEKQLELQTQVPNKFIENIVRSMFWSDNIKFDNDSSSFVEDGYGGNVSIYSIIRYIISTAPNVKFKAQIKEGDVWVDDEGSDLIKLINNPNPYDTYSTLTEQLLGWKLIDGAMYGYAPRIPIGRNKGTTQEIWAMPSTNMEIVGGGIRKPIEGFRYNQWEEMIPAEDVLYMKYFNPVSANENLSGILTGMSPLRAAVLTAKKSNSAAQAGVSAYENNGAMGVISNQASEFANFSPELAQKLEEKWKSDNGGAGNYGKVAFTGGTIDFNRLNMSPADLRLGESELQSLRQLGGVYKFPTQLLNDAEGATFSNQEQAQKSVYENTIIPEMTALGEGYNRWLGEAYYPGVESRIITDTSEIAVLQVDREKQVSWLVDAWWLTPNEKRKEMNKEELKDPKMDDVYVPNNVTASGDLDLLGEINGNTGANNEE